ncbi:hypothetical protein L1987_76122 [Smallanthus sonchifolius]|uniref:Uncharacterized protein n=1 Tax=Smallanthus sonchifolius TaxID=185202 RepID=A0ACB9A924_9ASTR|nr:hypothetical protein L1987_76122 [Smallanthus sonchifolius]
MAKSTTAAHSSSRFLHHLTVPENAPDLNNNNGFELHESDVIWSSSSDASEIPSPSNVTNSPPIHRQFNSGLYAALSDDQHVLVRRKPSMSPSQSAATATRTIPPVALRRSSEHYHQSAPVNVPAGKQNEALFRAI